MRQGWITDTWGDKHHYVNGERHSINDISSFIRSDGLKVWYKEGIRHRELGPACIWPDGEKEYWFEGIRYLEITSDLEWLMKIEELKNSS